MLEEAWAIRIVFDITFKLISLIKVCTPISFVCLSKIS